jgi:palmitoyltransferase
LLYLPTAWPQIGTLTKITGTISILLPYVFLYLSAFTDPGYITSANHIPEMARYPYDFTLFHPGNECSTCRFLKPARSKHCSVCKRCIAKNDHHCIFINNCVGARNQHWFILLLLSTAVLTLYGGLLGMHIMSSKMRARFPYWALLPWRANAGAGMPLKQWLIIWSWGMHDGVAMAAVTLLALMTSPLVWGLLGYHVWLVYCGTTTNESMKWSDWQAEMDDGFVFKRRVEKGRAKDLRIEPAWTRWPVEPEQVLVRTVDGKPPAQDADLPGVGEWEAVWRLKDVENLYDIGFWDNLLDVFVPGFMFRDPRMPVSESRLRLKKKRRAKKIYLA